MDSESLLVLIKTAHEENRHALAAAQQRLMRAAALLNRQIQLLGGSPAWVVPLDGLGGAGDHVAAPKGDSESLPSAPHTTLESMSTAELTSYVSDLRSCLFPFQESTLGAISAMCEVVAVCDNRHLTTPAMRRQWSAIEASLLNLLGEEITAEIHNHVEMALQAIRERCLPYRITDG